QLGRVGPEEEANLHSPPCNEETRRRKSKIGCDTVAASHAAGARSQFAPSPREAGRGLKTRPTISCGAGAPQAAPTLQAAPHTNPLPASRGEGAHRVCRRFMHRIWRSSLNPTCGLKPGHDESKTTAVDITAQATN